MTMCRPRTEREVEREYAAGTTSSSHLMKEKTRKSQARMKSDMYAR